MDEDAAILMADYHFGKSARLTDEQKARLAILKSQKPPVMPAPPTAPKKPWVSANDVCWPVVWMIVGYLIAKWR